jgi:hypothetical protein
MEPNRIVRHSDVLHGELVRDPQAPGTPELFPPHPVYGQVPSRAPSQHDQNGQPAVANGGGDRELPEVTKRRQVEAYLAGLGPDQLGRLTTLGPRAAARELTGSLNSQGVSRSRSAMFSRFSTSGRPLPASRPMGDAAPADPAGGREEPTLMTTAHAGWWWERRVQRPTSDVSGGRGAVATEALWSNRLLAHRARLLEPEAVDCP